MGIKATLIILPVCFILVLLCSVFFVPSVAETTRDPSRMERMVTYVGADAEQMNPWLSSKTSDSDISGYIFNGLVTSDANYKLKPNLAQTVRVGEEVVVVLSANDDAATVRNALEQGMTEAYPNTFDGIEIYDARKFDTSPKGFRTNVSDLKDSSSPAKDGATRLVVKFFPDRKKEYRRNDLPVAVQVDIGEKLDAAIEKHLSAKGFVSKFDQLMIAAGWYAKKYEIVLPKLELKDRPKAPAGNADEAAKKAHADVAKRIDEDNAKAREAFSKTLTDLAREKTGVKDLDSFDAYLSTFPQARMSEHPVVSIKLRDGVRWHDYATTGQTLDADDVAFTYEFGRDEAVNSPNKMSAASILQFRIHDRLNLDLVYQELYSPALEDLGMAILPQHKFTDEEWTKQAIARGRGPAPGQEDYNPRKALPATELEFSKNPVGTGPYRLYPLNGDRLPRWKSGERITLERYDDYWNKERYPECKYMDFYIFDPNLGAETADLVFRTGGLDNYSIRPHQVHEFEEWRDRYYIYKRQLLSYEYIGFNVKNELFSDKRVRQALTMAVDVDSIIKYVVFGQAQRISGPSCQLLPWYDKEYAPTYTYRQGPHKGKTLRDAGRQYFPYDLDEAAALLQEVGWVMGDNGKLMKDGKPFQFKILIGQTVASSRGKIALLAVEQLKKLGIDVEIEEREWTVFINEYVRPRKFDMLVLGWSLGTDCDWREIWHSTGPKNFGTFVNPEIDRLLEGILREYDYPMQVEKAKEIFRRTADECPYIFVFSQYGNTAVDRKYFWKKPIINEETGEVVGHEERPLMDLECMVTNTGPGFNQLQWVRSDSIKFPFAPDEPNLVRGDAAWRAYNAKYPTTKK